MKVLSRLQAMSAFLARETPWFVTAVAVVTFFCPQLFNWVRGDAQTAVLGFIMLTMGMTLTTDDFKILASRPLDIAIGSLAQFALMPLIAWTLVHLFGLPRGVAVGLILVGCCPGGVSSNLMSFLCKGDVAFSVGITTLSTLMAPLTTPLLMMMLAGEMVSIDAWGMFRSVMIVTLLPVGAGFALNRLLSRLPAGKEVKSLLPGMAVIGLACIVGGVVSAQGHAIVDSGALIFAGVLVHNGMGYVLGYLTGVGARFTLPKRRTIAIEVGMQNAGLATVLATRHFPQLPEAAIASAVSCIWHSISGAFLAGLFNWIESRRTARNSTAPSRA